MKKLTLGSVMSALCILGATWFIDLGTKFDQDVINDWFAQMVEPKKKVVSKDWIDEVNQKMRLGIENKNKLGE
jgi:hypothetical protein